jgi:hypothetical protein
MDVRGTHSIWQLLAKVFQPAQTAANPAQHTAQAQTEKGIKATAKVHHFAFDPNSPLPDGPIRRGMLVDIVV